MKYTFLILILVGAFQSCKSQSDLDKILSSKESDFDKVMNLFELFPDDLDAYNEYQLKVIYVSGLDGQVRNGGFSQYFFNTTGSNTYETLAVLKEIKANRSAELLEQAIQAYPKLPIKKDTGDRRDDMEDLPEETYEEWDKLDTQFYQKEEDLDKLIIQYVKQNRKKF